MATAYPLTDETAASFCARVADMLNDLAPPLSGLGVDSSDMPLATVAVFDVPTCRCIAFAFGQHVYDPSKRRRGPIVTGYEAIGLDGSVTPEVAGPFRTEEKLAKALVAEVVRQYKENPT